MSVLEHILGEDVATVPTDRGVFLRRLDACTPTFASSSPNEIYEDRLTSHESCALQRTDHGTGLRWLRAEHAERSTESVEEAELVADEIRRLIGSNWTDPTAPSGCSPSADFMVVAPYNDQVNLMRRMFDNDPVLPASRSEPSTSSRAAGPVVFFTMTTSTAQDMPRGPGFLFSRNRLNVALSRAQCLAYVVCTESCLNSRAKSVEEMRLISTLCSAVDYADAT